MTRVPTREAGPDRETYLDLARREADGDRELMPLGRARKVCLNDRAKGVVSLRTFADEEGEEGRQAGDGDSKQEPPNRAAAQEVRTSPQSAISCVFWFASSAVLVLEGVGKGWRRRKEGTATVSLELSLDTGRACREGDVSP